MLAYLGDITSDLSAFHRIDDAAELEAAVFFDLALRLPAYAGALAARITHDEQARPAARSTGRMNVTYDHGSEHVNNAAVRRTDAPATAATLTGLNAQLGGQWFTHATAGGG